MIQTLEDARQSTAAALTITECARITGINHRTISKACHAGQIPFVRFGKLFLIPREQFIAIFDAKAPNEISA